MAATAVAIAATVLQIAYLWRKNGFVEPMQWVSLGVIVVFGGATLLTQDETFIKWKPTVLYWLMGGALWVGHYVFKRNFIQQLMGAQVELPAHAWGGCCIAGRASLPSWAASTFGWPTTLTPTRG